MVFKLRFLKDSEIILREEKCYYGTKTSGLFEDML